MSPIKYVLKEYAFMSLCLQLTMSLKNMSLCHSVYMNDVYQSVSMSFCLQLKYVIEEYVSMSFCLCEVYSFCLSIAC